MLQIGKSRALNKSVLRRFYGSQVQDSKFVRQEFLNYFVNADHKFVPSSPVIPYNDPTTPFVNAGMHQFKGVLLGLNNPPASKIVNSQKCIRVGGKHNDIDIVGTDTYHHTFFEMLGNWSFGDYFKKDACELAWNLLTGPYNINKEYLYVTYFKGDDQLGIKPDLECKEIWRQLGVMENRILPFGTRDNFWEMGPTGPCGPSTEIHIDHSKSSLNQAERVNKGLADLTELWNIVFIQYQRLNDGTVIPLSNYSVDTGMGFERLLSVIQNKRSNYDTDLFQPLFVAIENFAKVPKYKGRYGPADTNGMDTGYRILADHARMITVALSDGVYPDQNPKLRQVLRNAINISEDVFRKNGLLKELSYRIVEILGETYPELEKNINKVQTIINYEEETRKSLRDTVQTEWNKIVKTRPKLATISEVTPGLIPAYNELQNLIKRNKINKITGELALKLYDTYGLNAETIMEIANIEALSFEIEDFKQELERMKNQSRLKHMMTSKHIIPTNVLNILEKSRVPKTNDSFKYFYSCENNKYKFPAVTSKLLDIIVDGNLLSESGLQIFDESQLVMEATVVQSGNVIQKEAVINPTNEVAILLDQTPCYAEEGGQLCDKGFIKINNLLFAIENVLKIRSYVFHVGHFVIEDTKNMEFEFQIGDECLVQIDEKHRLGAMRHHTATHLLNAALKQLLPVSSQRASTVSTDNLSYECIAFGNKLTLNDITTIETLINDTIKANVPVNTKTINMLQMLADDEITTIPGEVYPDDHIRVTEISDKHLKSKEACCGTHVYNTSHLEQFCILDFKIKDRSSMIFKATVGPSAEQAKLAGEKFTNKLKNMETEFSSNTVHKQLFNRLLNEMRKLLKHKNNANPIAYVAVHDCMKRINDLHEAMEMREKETMRIAIETEMNKVMKSSTLPFVVHYLQINDGSLDAFPLSKITQLCSNVPVLIITYNQGSVEARCCVPKEMMSEKFNAQSWMKTISPIFNSRLANSKSDQVCNMKATKISSDKIQILVNKCITEATKFASTYLLK